MPVMGEGLINVDESTLPDAIPILALRNAVIFPGTVFPVTIGRPKSVRLVRDVESKDGLLGAVPQTDVNVEEPAEQDLYKFGTVCKVVKTLEMPDGSITAILQGVKRLELDGIVSYEPYIVARVHYREDIRDEMPQDEKKVLMESLKEKAAQIVMENPCGQRNL